MPHYREKLCACSIMLEAYLILSVLFLFLSKIIMVTFCIEFVDCPVFENDKIVQQPADLLTLTENYVSAASSFIKSNAGQ